MNVSANLFETMKRLGREARNASYILSQTSPERKNGALWAMAEALYAHADAILEANAKDMQQAREYESTDAQLDRLMLDSHRLTMVAEGLVAITNIVDPVGSVIKEWARPNGLHIQQVRVPIGVIGVIYESRPNVTADAAGLCLKAGNSVILRPGTDSFATALAMTKALHAGLRKAQLPEACIVLVPSNDRDAVGHMLGGLDGTIDVIVPRGGKSLVARVKEDARIPVFAHLEGICHVYVDGAANLKMARNIVLNSKMRRPGICGAAETLLVDKACVLTMLDPLIKMLLDAGCEVRGETDVRLTDPRVKPSTEADWRTEYLDKIISVKVVDGVEGAIKHINMHSSQHTDAIVTENAQRAEKFLREVDSAIVLHNASTQFADGGEFGFGAEIGIATGRMHARGPVGAEQLTTMKYRVHGQGQVRS